MAGRVEMMERGDRWSPPRLDPAVTRQLLVVLVVAAVAEVLLLRLTTRIGVHLPKDGIVADAIGAASFSGTLALNVASILATGLLVLVLAAIAWRTRSALLRWSVVGLGAAMLWGLAVGLLAAPSSRADLTFGLSATLLAVVLGVLAVRPSISPRGRLALGLIVVAYAAHQYYAVGHLAYQQLGYTDALPAGIAVLRTGELLVLLAGGVAFWAWGLGRWERAGLVGGVFAIGPAFLLLATSFSPASTTSILALWTTGLTFYLPLPFYLVALAAYLFTIAACARSRDGAPLAVGLLLVLLAGYMPEATYYHVAFVLGVALLAGHGGLLVGESTRTPAEPEAE